MEKESKPVRFSKQFELDLTDVYKHGIETFGKVQADKYLNNIYRLVNNLKVSYTMYPECSHLPTKSKMYRWIILESHLIIYRITNPEIQVLRIIYAGRSTMLIKSSRSIKI